MQELHCQIGLPPKKNAIAHQVCQSIKYKEVWGIHGRFKLCEDMQGCSLWERFFCASIPTIGHHWAISSLFVSYHLNKTAKRKKTLSSAVRIALSHVIGIWATDSVLATGTSITLFDALQSHEAREFSILVVVHHWTCGLRCLHAVNLLLNSQNWKGRDGSTTQNTELVYKLWWTRANI